MIQWRWIAVILMSAMMLSGGARAFAPLSSSAPTLLSVNKQPNNNVQEIAYNNNPRENVVWSQLFSSFYDDFEDFENFKKDDDKNENNSDDDDDEEDEDDDEYADLDDISVEDFRSKMGAMFGEDPSPPQPQTESSTPPPPAGPSDTASVDELISFATGSGDKAQEEPTDWAKPASELKPGVIILANPAKFCNDIGPKPSTPNPSLLAKFGLTLPPPADLGPDRRADLLPVLALVEMNGQRGCRAVLLNRRTGYLLGDLEQPPPGAGDEPPPAVTPLLEKFCIQPLWFGGIDNISSGLDMLHLCPAVEDATKLTDDGLYWGGDPSQAQEVMEDPSLDRVMTGFDFKFFVQSTLWSPKELEREIKDGTWITAEVSKEILFKSRDRMGTRRAKPLWTEVMELLGGEYKELRDEFYGESS